MECKWFAIRIQTRIVVFSWISWFDFTTNVLLSQWAKKARLVTRKKLKGWISRRRKQLDVHATAIRSHQTTNWKNNNDKLPKEWINASMPQLKTTVCIYPQRERERIARIAITTFRWPFLDRFRDLPDVWQLLLQARQDPWILSRWSGHGQILFPWWHHEEIPHLHKPEQVPHEIAKLVSFEKCSECFFKFSLPLPQKESKRATHGQQRSIRIKRIVCRRLIKWAWSNGTSAASWAKLKNSWRKISRHPTATRQYCSLFTQNSAARLTFWKASWEASTQRTSRCRLISTHCLDFTTNCARIWLPMAALSILCPAKNSAKTY